MAADRNAMPREPLAAVASAAAALAPFADAAGDSASALAALFDFVRPRDLSGIDGSATRYTAVIELLEADPARAAEVRRHVMRLLAEPRLVGFFADSGILPGTGFFTELGRILAVRLFHRRGDWIWFSALPSELPRRFWHLIARKTADDDAVSPAIVGQVLEALLILGYRLGGIDVDGEFRRLGPEFKGHAACFRGLTGATQRYVDTQRAHLLDPGVKPLDSAEVQLLVDQCQSVIERARQVAGAQGTSVRLSYMIRRSAQTLQRIEDLGRLLDAWVVDKEADLRRQEVIERWSALVRLALAACAAMLRVGSRCWRCGSPRTRRRPGSTTSRRRAPPTVRCGVRRWAQVP